MLGVAGVDMLPGFSHAGDLGGIVELLDESVGEFFGGGAGEHAGDVHIGVASASETKVDDADDFIVFIEEDIAEIEVAVDEILFFGLFDVDVILVNVLVVMLVI